MTAKEDVVRSFSALQRAEIAEIVLDDRQVHAASCFSALQRAEIAEIVRPVDTPGALLKVSVLFNEPKLLKYDRYPGERIGLMLFQCSSTSRNC